MTPGAAQSRQERGRLAARLVALGAIPIAVFCGAFALARAALGTGQQGQFWTWMVALAAAIAAVFVLARRTARALEGDIAVIHEAVRHAALGAGQVDLPEVEEPLEGLKREVLGLAADFRGREQWLQERLDTSRQQLFFLSSHDGLTGLANRKAFEERLESAIAAARGLGKTHALLYLDIDHLHRINDAFGHLAGDELLRRIVPVLRGTLGEGELLARIGGDEFAVLVEGCDADEAREVALRLRDAVQAWPFEWGEHAFQVGVSVGVVAITRLTQGPSAALNEADSACFAAKEQGRNRVVAFHGPEAAQQARVTSRGWLRRINDAISAGAFTLLYQPIVPLGGARQPGAVPRVEALLRMSETGGELVLPLTFIPVAERYDLMRAIDRWVIERAFADFARLAAACGRERPVEVSINLSGHSLSSPDFPDQVREAFAAHAVPPDCVRFEITETAAIASAERARRAVDALRGLGVRFWLDDFGGGLSAFQYLRHFPVEGVKIDGSFVKGVARGDLDRAVVVAIQGIAGKMSLATAAVHVESAEIAAELDRLGVPWGQGFHLGAPRALDAVAADLTTSLPLPPARP